MPDVQREQRESENAETWRDFDATLEPWASLTESESRGACL
jgi:hypothetical protein